VKSVFFLLNTVFALEILYLISHVYLSLLLSGYTDIWNICAPYVIAAAIGCSFGAGFRIGGKKELQACKYEDVCSKPSRITVQHLFIHQRKKISRITNTLFGLHNKYKQVALFTSSFIPINNLCMFQAGLLLIISRYYSVYTVVGICSE
jgi:hypothetical protein